MYSEDDLLPISALQHLLFCERQCALIHIEQAWSENLFTAEGRIMHERVDSGGRESRGRIRLAFGLALRSLRLGLVGKADVVEFHREEPDGWQPFPVEHKRGRPKKGNWDKVQLCAQAMCLEEMLDRRIVSGSLFYGKTRRRQDGFRRKPAAGGRGDILPAPRSCAARPNTGRPLRKKCESCSLIALCMPKVAGAGRDVAAYLSRMLT
ncbi:MAG: CRISPR-associated protein Cas4 [Thermodesulfobacteriota bacterium]